MGQVTPHETAQSRAYEAGIQKLGAEDPSIGFETGAAHQRLEESLAGPGGGPWSRQESPEVAQAMRYAGHQQINQRSGQLRREDRFRRQEAQVGHLGQAAGLFRPTPYASQVDQTGTGKTTEPWGPAAIGAAGTALGGFLSGV